MIPALAFVVAVDLAMLGLATLVVRRACRADCPPPPARKFRHVRLLLPTDEVAA